jgi:hypothetical protein
MGIAESSGNVDLIVGNWPLVQDSFIGGTKLSLDFRRYENTNFLWHSIFSLIVIGYSLFRQEEEAVSKCEGYTPAQERMRFIVLIRCDSLKRCCLCTWPILHHIGDTAYLQEIYLICKFSLTNSPYCTKQGVRLLCTLPVDGQEFKKSLFVEGLGCLGLMTDNI